MPQTFQVLRCYKCAVFQVHPTKKSNKWKCKLCNEKQSIKRFYGIGTGKECRVHVQKLNEIRGDIHNDQNESKDSSECNDTEDSSEDSETVHQAIAKKSKWMDYIDIANEQDQLNNTCPGETGIIVEKPKKRPWITSMKSNLSKKGECLISTKFLNDIHNDNIVKSLHFNEPTISHSNNVSLIPQIKKVVANKYISNQTVQNSKWAQFVEDTENVKKEDYFTGSNDSLDERKTSFSLFDDDDDNLDAVLEL